MAFGKSGGSAPSGYGGRPMARPMPGRNPMAMNSASQRSAASMAPQMNNRQMMQQRTISALRRR